MAVSLASDSFLTPAEVTRRAAFLSDVLRKQQPNTYLHGVRVADFASAAAKRLSLDVTEITHLCTLHDIGKLDIEVTILEKPDSLTNKEYALVREHAEYGWRRMRLAGLHDLASVVRHHHERWDGGGYPDGLSGAIIPIASRLIAVADAFDAMLERPYRAPLDRKGAICELERGAGNQFDPKIVEVFLSTLRI